MPVSFDYADESDRGRYPIPPRAPIEGGPGSSGDRHVIVVDRSRCRLYELFDAHPLAGGARWHAGSGAIFNLRSNRLRPRGWTSADAAGLPILPGLARYDEVRRGRINHALRFTASRTRRAFVYPARHFASELTDPDLPAMGQRLRLKRGFDISRFPRQSRIVLSALKRYGMILADNGSSWYVSGAPEPRLGQRRPALAARRARQRLRGRGQLSFAPPLGVGWPNEAGPGRLLRLAVRQLARPALSRGPRPRDAGSSATRRSSTPSRSTRPSTGSPRRDAVARWVEQTPPDFLFAAKASRYLTHVRRLQNLAEGIGRYYERHRAACRVRQARVRSSGSSPRTSSATTTALGARPAAARRRGGTASSSATRAGSRRRSTSCCAPTAPRS